MICPLLLKQTKKMENGLEEWERQPCLEEACSLFYGKKKKCSLFQNTETTHEMRNILDQVDFVSSFQVIRSELDGFHRDVAGRMKAQQEEFEQRQSTLEAEVGRLSEQMSREIREHLAERISTVQGQFQSWTDRLGESTQGLTNQLQGVHGEFAQELRKTDEKIGLVETLCGRLDASLKGVGERLETLEERLTEKVTENLQKVAAVGAAVEAQLNGMQEHLQQELEQGRDLATERRAEQAAGVQRMETLLGETRQVLEELVSGQRQIEAYYENHKEHVDEATRSQRHEAAREQNNRGVVYFHRGAHEAAMRAFEKAVELDPEYADAYNNLGLTYTELHRSDHAVQAFQQALKLKPDLVEANHNLGVHYYAVMDYEKARELFSKALDDGCRERSMAYTNYGNSLYQLERYAEAAEAWNKALQINPVNQNAKKGLELLNHQQQGVW